MKKKSFIEWIICGIIFLIETFIQIFGSIYYNETPSWVWAIANGLQFFVPITEGLIKGLISLIPNIVSEIIWYIRDKYISTIFHSIAFLISIIILGISFIFMEKKEIKIKLKIIINAFLFELFLLLEEIIYYSMRTIFLSKKNQLIWENISISFMSIPNPALLIVLVFFIYHLEYLDQRENSSTVEGPLLNDADIN